MVVSLVKILLVATFSGVHLTQSFYTNDYIAKMNTTLDYNISFGRYGGRVQVIRRPIF